MLQDPVLDMPVTISTIDEFLTACRPDTLFKQIANVMFFVYKTNYVIGAPVELPEFIKNSKSIIGLVRDRGGDKLPYDDDKCLFRAISLCNGADVKALARPTEALITQWLHYKHESIFRRVHLDELPEVETCFSIRINMYEMMSEGIVRPVYISLAKHPKT